MNLGLPRTARQYAEIAEDSIGEGEVKVAHVYAMLCVASAIQEEGLFREHPDD